MTIKRPNASGITKTGTAISDVPDAPTIGAVTDLVAGGQVTVAFTAAVTGGTPTNYTATSTPSSITGSNTSSPITVTGLTNGTAYTFTVRASNSTGNSPESSASSAVTPTIWAQGYMDALSTVTVPSGGASSITFAGIPQSGYQHLQIRGICQDTLNDVASLPTMQFNNDTGSNYARHKLFGNGSTASASGNASQTSMSVIYSSASLSTSKFGAFVIDILDYTNTSKYKTVRSLSGLDLNTGTTDSQITFNSGLWMSTSAVNTITFTPAANFAQYTQFTLYGIRG